MHTFGFFSFLPAAAFFGLFGFLAAGFFLTTVAANGKVKRERENQISGQFDWQKWNQNKSKQIAEHTIKTMDTYPSSPSSASERPCRTR